MPQLFLFFPIHQARYYARKSVNCKENRLFDAQEITSFLCEFDIKVNVLIIYT